MSQITIRILTGTLCGEPLARMVHHPRRTREAAIPKIMQNGKREPILQFAILQFAEDLLVFVYNKRKELQDLQTTPPPNHPHPPDFSIFRGIDH